jgi:phage protein D
MVFTGRVLTPQPEVLVSYSRLGAAAQAALRSVTVVTELGFPAMFALELVNRDLMPGEVPWADQTLFDLGTAVEVGIPNGKALIRGEVTGLEPEFTQSRQTVVVRGYDPLHRLLRGQKTRTFAQVKDSDIAIQIAREASLHIKTEDTRIQHDYVLQHNQSDLEFLQQRASRIGYGLAIAGEKTLHFRPAPTLAMAPTRLSFPEQLRQFSPRLSSLGQVSRVEVRGWDVTRKEPIVGHSTSINRSDALGTTAGDQATQRNFGRAFQVRIDQPIADVEAAQQMAQGQFRQMALGYITGEGQCRGDPGVQAGQQVEIVGVGRRFSGQYYVTAAVHTFGPHRDYTTEFYVERNAHND